MKWVQWVSKGLAAVISFHGLSLMAASEGRYPSQTNFCAALFSTSSQEISEKQNANENRWPIKTLNAAQNFLNDKIISKAASLPAQPTWKEKLFRQYPNKIAFSEVKKVHLATRSTFDTRHQPITNSSKFLRDGLIPFIHLKKTELLLTESFADIPISSTEYRGSEAILRFLQETKDLSKLWQTKMDADTQDIYNRLSASDRKYFLNRTAIAMLGGVLISNLIDYLSNEQYILAAIPSFFLIFDKIYRKSFLDIQKLSYALISSKGRDQLYNEQEHQSSQKAQLFMDEVALILNQKSDWNPSSDFMHLSSGIHVPKELAQSIAYGSSEEYLQQQIATHAHEDHKTSETPEHYWFLGYQLSFAYLPEDPAFPDLNIEPTLIMTTYLSKSDTPPPAPKKPKKKKSTKEEESLENNGSLAPIRY